MADLEPMPISTLPKADQLETDDQMIAYREETGKAYRSNVGALGEAAQGAISDAFSETKTYNAGDYCIYNDTLYKFTEDKDIGEWDDSVVEKTTATAEIQSNTDLIDSLFSVKNISDSITISVSWATLEFAYYCGGFVMFQIYGTFPGSSVDVATIASPYRPKARVFGWVNANGMDADRGSTNINRARIATGGTLNIWGSAGTGEQEFTFIYPVGIV